VLLDAVGKRLKMVIFFLCVLLPLAGWLGFGKQGLVHLYRTERERQRYIAHILKLAEENQALLDEIHRLGNDMDYLASVARKELSLIKKNEVIYRFSGNDRQGGGDETSGSGSDVNR
jgi:cell division protein FtsB